MLPFYIERQKQAAGSLFDSVLLSLGTKFALLPPRWNFSVLLSELGVLCRNIQTCGSHFLLKPKLMLSVRRGIVVVVSLSGEV